MPGVHTRSVEAPRRTIRGDSASPCLRVSQYITLAPTGRHYIAQGNALGYVIHNVCDSGRLPLPVIRCFFGDSNIVGVAFG